MGFLSDIVKIGTLGLVDLDAGEDAALQAGQLQAEAAAAGIAETRRQFDITEERLRPAVEAGDLARQQQLALLGLSGQEQQQAAFTALQESPGQRFIRERAQKSLLRGASAIGGLGGGNIRTALVEQGAGFAQQDVQNQFGRLQQVTAPGTTAAINLGQFGQQTGANVSNLLQTQGQAQASGILGAQQVKSQFLDQLITGAGAIAGFA